MLVITIEPYPIAPEINVTEVVVDVKSKPGINTIPFKVTKMSLGLGKLRTYPLSSTPSNTVSVAKVPLTALPTV
jgi:hypothetical protein